MKDELPSGVQYWEEEVAKEDVKSKKKPVEDDYDDEVFLSWCDHAAHAFFR